MPKKIQNTIENLYEVFSKYPGNSKMQASPNYGNIDQWNSGLFSKPLTALDEEDLSLFTGKVLTTWGELDDFKHFLPRILELTSQLNPPYEVQVVYHKLDYAKWQDWDLDEREAIIEFNRALWISLLNNRSEKAYREFSEYFYSLFYSHPKPSGLLELWDRETSNEADIHLAKFIYVEGHKLFEDHVDMENENIAQLGSWLLSPAKLQRLQKAFFENEQEAFAEEISWSEKILENAIKKTDHSAC